MKLFNFHSDGNTWKYTLDILNIRIVFKRRKKFNSLGDKIPYIKIDY